MKFICQNCNAVLDGTEAVKIHTCGEEPQKMQVILIYVDTLEHREFEIPAHAMTGKDVAAWVMQAWLDETCKMRHEGGEHHDHNECVESAWTRAEMIRTDHFFFVRYEPYRGEDVTFLISR